VNRTPSTHSSTRWIVRGAVAGLSVMGLLLAFQEIPAASAQPRPAQAASSSTVKHWGTFFGGANPLKPEDTITSPASVRLPGRVAAVASSNSSEYALLTDGSVYAWGLGNAGQLGDGATQNSFTEPVRVRFPAGVKIASLPINVMPYDTGLAVDTKGHVWGWGDNQGGELCLGNNHQHLTPVRLPFSDVTAVAGAFDHALYDAKGQVWACGLNSLGELGDGTTRPSPVPVKVTGLGPSARVVFLVAAFANSGALLADGRYLDWGTNAEGQLGIGTRRASALPVMVPVPVLVPLPARVLQVSQGGSAPGNGQTLTLLTNGDLYAWGANGQGQLGDGKTAAQSSPERITPPRGVTYRTVATSGATSYGISTRRQVYAWGGGTEGQIGNGTTESSFAQVGIPTCATGISATADDVVINCATGISAAANVEVPVTG
jgi:alpha-tubulin suppressor-like RCC1 family protein